VTSFEVPSNSGLALAMELDNPVAYRSTGFLVIRFGAQLVSIPTQARISLLAIK